MANINDPYNQQLYNQTGGTFFERDLDGEFSFTGQVGDIFQGGVNGAEEALRSTFGLINYVNPFSRQEGDMVEFDFIDDPDTGLGQLAGGFAQYAVGAALVTGGVLATLSGMSAFMALGAGALATAGKAAGAVSALKNVMGFTLKAQQWYRGAKLGEGVGMLSGRKAFEYVVQSPMIDFAAFGAESGRFVDILNNNENLSNAVTEALASDEDDPVLWARAKNVLDGAIAGGVTDGFFAGFKKLAKLKKIEADAKGLDETTPDDIRTRVKAEAERELKVYQETLDTNLQLSDLDPEELRQMAFTADMSDFRPEFAESIDSLMEGYADEGDIINFLRLAGDNTNLGVDEMLDASPRDRRKFRKMHKDSTTMKRSEKLKEIFAGEGITWEDMGNFNAPKHATENMGHMMAYTLYGSLDDAARMSLENAKAKYRGEPLPWPELKMSEVKEGATKQGLDEIAEDSALLHVKHAELLKDIDDISLGIDAMNAMEFVSRQKHDPAAIVRMGAYARKANQWANALQQKTLRLLKEMDGLPAAEKAEYRLALRNAQLANFQLLESSKAIWSASGWSLATARHSMVGDINPYKKGLMSRKFGKSIDGGDIIEEYDRMLRKATLDPQVNKQLEGLEQHMKESLSIGKTPGERAEMIAKWSEQVGPGEMFKHGVNVRIQNIISGAKTISIAAWSPLFVEPYRSVRNILGEVWMQTNPGAAADADRLVKVAQRELYTTFEGINYSMQGVKGYLQAVRDSATKRDGSLKDYHSYMRQQANSLRLGDRFSMDVNTVTAAQRDAWAQSGNLGTMFTGWMLKAQSAMAVGAHVIPALDYAVQNGIGRARVEGNMFFKGLMEGVDVHTAKRMAHNQAEAVFLKSHNYFKLYSADEVFKKSIKDAEGGIPLHQAVVENIAKGKRDIEDVRVNMDDARVRAGGAVLNNDVKQMALSVDEKLKAGLISEEAMLERGAPLTGSPEELAAIQRRMQDPGVGHVLGSEAVRVGASVAADAAASIRKTPALRLFAPFLQVPINSAALGLDVVVGGAVENLANGISMGGARAFKEFPLVTKFINSLKSADPAVRMNAAVDGYMAATVVGTVGTLLSQPGMSVPTEQQPLPTITGGGPSDTAQLEAMRAAGWQPYSIRIGDKYYSYSRMEPFASWLGMLADSMQVAHYYDAQFPHDKADDALNTVLVTGMALMARNITDKTFTRGLGDLFDIMSGDAEAGKRWVAELGRSTLVPNSIRDVANYAQGDLADIKAANTFIDKLWLSIPGGSTQVKDKRRNLLGEPVKRTVTGNILVDPFIPVNARLVTDSVIEKELARIPNNWRGTPTRYRGVDTLDELHREDGRSLHDRWQEEMTKVTIRGKTLRQSLRILIKEDQYLQHDPGLTDDGKYSPRAGMIESVIRKYREAAMRELVDREPKTRSAINAAKAAEKARRDARAARGEKSILTLLD